MPQLLTSGYDPIVLAAALAVALGGFFVTAGVFNEAMGKGHNHNYWNAITAVVGGTSLWAVSFLLELAYSGGLTERFSASAAASGLILSVLSSMVALMALRVRTSSFRITLSRIIFGIVPIGVVFLNKLALSVYHLPAGIALVLTAAAALFAISTCSWLTRDWDGRTCRVTPQFLIGSGAAAVFLIHVVLAPIFLPTSYLLLQPIDYANHIMPILLGMLMLGLVASAAHSLDQSRTAEALERYRSLAMHDGLTGLPNRLCMQRELEQWIAAHDPDQGPIAIAVIDLDRFKDVNDVHGHAAGDALLKGVSQELARDLGGQEHLFRTGGDEFVAVKLDCGSRDGAAQFARRMCGSLAGFDSWMTGDARIGGSIGVCLYPDDGSEIADLLSRADQAMYRAKGQGGGQTRMFDDAMDEAQRAKKALSMDLNAAMAENQLEVYWQPQVDARNGAVFGFEALLRWDHPERGPISPAEFIPLAEQTGQILELGAWVMRNACAEAARWKRPYRIAVNVAAGQVNQSDLRALVETTLSSTGLPPTRLELEITETGIIRDANRALETIWNIKDMGVGLVMDDFGTGYSSLSTLQAFPFDKIKIDRAFISEIGKSTSADAIVEATIQIAHAMGSRVLAEGVEEFEQISALNKFGCHEMQGYYFSRPIRAHEARKLYGLMDTSLAAFERDGKTDTPPPRADNLAAGR